MIELVEDEYSKYPDDAVMQKAFSEEKDSLEKRKDEIFDKIDHEPEKVQLVTSFFTDEGLVNDLKQNANLTLDFIAANHGITESALEQYHSFSKFKYECGMYKDAEDMLANYLSVGQPESGSVLAALWGRLACRILQVLISTLIILSFCYFMIFRLFVYIYPFSSSNVLYRLIGRSL